MLQVRAKDRVDIDRILVHPWLFRAATSEADDETKPESLPKSPPPQSPSPYANGYGSGSGGRSLDQLSSSPMSLVQSFAQSMPHIRSTPPRKGSAPLIQSDHLNVALNASNANSNSARSSTDSLEEGELMAMLSRVGINTKAMERSVRRDACDALTALYYILGTRLRRRNSALSIAASSVKTAPQLRSTSRHDDQLANQPLITRFNKSNPEDLSTIESTPMSMSPPPQPLHGMDNALRKMSLPWLSFTSSSSSSTNNQHSHSQHK
ncbi:hypothetical protein BDF19DRAFT_175372 [Syncephalis fuscata]|nr:hypothetical protein BDF19DRAFT_175372 [Syncephalis fuscata]